MPKIAIIWTPSPATEPYANMEGLTVFLEQQNWAEVLKKHQPDYIFLLLELGWEGVYYANFHGFEVLKELRVIHRYKKPIILCSLMPKAYFLNNKSNPDYETLKAPAHHFMQITPPFNFKEFVLPKAVNISLDDETLDDISESLFSLAGLISEEFHDLKNKALYDSKSKKLSNKKLFKELTDFVNNSYQKMGNYMLLSDNSKFLRAQESLIKDLENSIVNNNNRQASNRIIAEHEGRILRLLPNNNSNLKTENLEAPPWQVLFIDDDETARNSAESYFKERDIQTKLASTAQEAFDILDADVEQNKIAVVICDYRLYDENGNWQPIQGYNILKEIYTQKTNKVALFALTAANQRTMIRLMKTHEMKVAVHSKDAVMDSDEGFNVFVEEVIRDGNEIYEIIGRIPPVKVWTSGYGKKLYPSYGYYYRLHISSKDFLTVKTQITERANLFFEEFRKKHHDKNYPITLTLPDWQAEINNEKYDHETNMERFYTKLIGRRVALALFSHLEYTKAETYSILKTGTKAFAHKTNSTTINPFFSSYLGLKSGKTDPPIINKKYLLPEEISWLKNL